MHKYGTFAAYAMIAASRGCWSIVSLKVYEKNFNSEL